MDETRLSLLEQVRHTGNHEAWAEFVRIYQPLLARYVFKCRLPEHAVEEVVQVVLVNLLRRLPSFQLDKSRGRFRSWLFTVVSNAVTDWRRQPAARHEVQAEDLPDPPDQRSDQAAEWDRTCQEHAFARACASVRQDANPSTWACFERFLLQDRPAKDVAAELDLTDVAVRKNAQRMLARVGELARQYLEEMDA